MRGELLGKILRKKAWRRVAHKLFGNYYEELTPYDRHLTEQYPNPGRFCEGISLCNEPASLLPGGISYVTGFQQAGKPAFAPAYSVPSAPPELIPEVDRAYFRLAQHDKIAAWFEAAGFDLSKPTIPEEEFERRIAKPSPAPKITNAMIDDHIRRYTESTPRHTGDGCEKAWAAQHGSAARARLRVRYRDHLQKRGNKIKEGRPQKLAK